MTSSVHVELRGSKAQVTWAESIREKALRGEGWSDQQLDILHRVNDATWWIVNRSDFRYITFKPPKPHQLADGPAPAEPSGNHKQRQMDLAQALREVQGQKTVKPQTDAAAFAASVSKKPKLAEVTILALLARLYTAGSKEREALRQKACAALLPEESTEQDARDLEAIARILRPI